MNEILQEAMGEHVLLHSKPDKLAQVRGECNRIIGAYESDSQQLGTTGAYARGYQTACRAVLAIINEEG